MFFTNIPKSDLRITSLQGCPRPDNVPLKLNTIFKVFFMSFDQIGDVSDILLSRFASASHPTITMAAPPSLTLDEEEVYRGTSYDLGRQPLLPTSPTARSAPIQRRKPRLDPLGCFWPLWSECVPLKTSGTSSSSPSSASVSRISIGETWTDWGALGVNVCAGLIMGVREALGGIVSASLLFSSSNVEISSMLQFGISMTLYTMSVGVLWYAVFGRLQYGYGTQQDLICILQAQLASKAAMHLQRDVEKIPATVFAIICFSSILTGIVSIAVGKLAWATSMLMIPKPIVSGFLGAIGVVVLQAAFKTSSGVPFHHFWPDMGLRAFCSSQDRLLQVGCMLLHFFCIQKGPDLCHFLLRTSQHPSRKDAVKKYAGLVCQLAPLFLFYGVVFSSGVEMIDLADHGWTYPKKGSSGPLTIWTSYSFAEVDFHVVGTVLFSMDIVALVAMAILCTMLGALAITGRYPTGPPGDPQPDDPLDFNAELITVGAASLFLGCTGGNLVFHKFSVIQLREDGGTHRIAVLTIALVAGNLFIFGCPIGAYVPKWFLGGLFMNTGWSFLRKTLLSYQTLTTFNWRGLHVVSPQYGISTCCVVMALFFSPTTSIMAGLCLSILLFVLDGMTTSPVSSVVDGQHVVSRTKRPWWEMNVLAAEGDRIRLLYLQLGGFERSQKIHISEHIHVRVIVTFFCLVGAINMLRYGDEIARKYINTCELESHTHIYIYACTLNTLTIFTYLKPLHY